MATSDDDQSLEKIQIPGPTFASLLQRFTSSSGDISGLLFGHVTHLSPANLSDDTDPTSVTPTTIATITNILQFDNKDNILNLSKDDNGVIGWFSGRRRTHLRPSLRESSVTAALSRKRPPCIFLLLTSPPPPPGNQNPNDSNNLIHTLEYRAYQFIKLSSKFDSKTLDIINMGPSFRGHYGSFSPTSQFPNLPCDFRGSSSMAQDNDNGESIKRVFEGVGIDVAKLSGLIGPGAANYTTGLEDMYKGMLARLEQLATLVNESDSRISKQLDKRHQAPNSQNDITRVASNVDQPGRKERENKKQKEVITYQRKRKRAKASVEKPPLLINAPMKQFSSIENSVELRQSDNVELKIVDVQVENVSPFVLGRIDPYSTLPEEYPTSVKGRVQNPEIKGIKGWDDCCTVPNLGGKSRVDLNGSDLQNHPSSFWRHWHGKD